MCRIVELSIGPSWYWGKAMNLALLDDDIQTGLFYLVRCLLEKKNYIVRPDQINLLLHGFAGLIFSVPKKTFMRMRK